MVRARGQTPVWPEIWASDRLPPLPRQPQAVNQILQWVPGSIITFGVLPHSRLTAVKWLGVGASGCAKLRPMGPSVASSFCMSSERVLPSARVASAPQPSKHDARSLGFGAAHPRVATTSSNRNTNIPLRRPLFQRHCFSADN